MRQQLPGLLPLGLVSAAGCGCRPRGTPLSPPSHPCCWGAGARRDVKEKRGEDLDLFIVNSFGSLAQVWAMGWGQGLLGRMAGRAWQDDMVGWGQGDGVAWELQPKLLCMGIGWEVSLGAPLNLDPESSTSRCVPCGRPCLCLRCCL